MTMKSCKGGEGMWLEVLRSPRDVLLKVDDVGVGVAGGMGIPVSRVIKTV